MARSSVFSRQLRYMQELINTYGRLTAEAVLRNDDIGTKEFSKLYASAQKFRSSTLWHDWHCSSFGVFVRKFRKLYEKGEV